MRCKFAGSTQFAGEREGWVCPLATLFSQQQKLAPTHPPSGGAGPFWKRQKRDLEHVGVARELLWLLQ